MICPFCNTDFEPATKQQIYCSSKCRSKHYYILHPHKKNIPINPLTRRERERMAMRNVRYKDFNGREGVFAV